MGGQGATVIAPSPSLVGKKASLLFNHVPTDYRSIDAGMVWDGPDKGDPLCLSVNFSKDPAFSSSSTVYTGYSFVDAEDLNQSNCIGP